MKVSRLNKGHWGKIKAFFDITVDVDVLDDDGNPVFQELTIKGFKLVEGINGLFVGFPSEKGQDGEYYDTIWAEKGVKEKITKLALEYHNAAVPNTEDEEIPF